MRIKEMTNVQLLLAYENALFLAKDNLGANTRIERWRKLQEEVCKRLGMTDEEIRTVWNSR